MSSLRALNKDGKKRKEKKGIWLIQIFFKGFPRAIQIQGFIHFFKDSRAA